MAFPQQCIRKSTVSPLESHFSQKYSHNWTMPSKNSFSAAWLREHWANKNPVGHTTAIPCMQHKSSWREKNMLLIKTNVLINQETIFTLPPALSAAGGGRLAEDTNVGQRGWILGEERRDKWWKNGRRRLIHVAKRCLHKKGEKTRGYYFMEHWI